jgi:hypothetical protein
MKDKKPVVKNPKRKGIMTSKPVLQTPVHITKNDVDLSNLTNDQIELYQRLKNRSLDTTFEITMHIGLGDAMLLFTCADIHVDADNRSYQEMFSELGLELDKIVDDPQNMNKELNELEKRINNFICGCKSSS